MREIRTSGSEGGGAGYPTSPSYPYRPPLRFNGRRIPTGPVCAGNGGTGAPHDQVS